MFETTNQNRFCLFNGTLHSSLPKNPMWTKQNTRPKHMMKWLAASIHPEPQSLHLTVAMNLCIHRVQLPFKIPYIIPYETQSFTTWGKRIGISVLLGLNILFLWNSNGVPMFSTVFRRSNHHPFELRQVTSPPSAFKICSSIAGERTVMPMPWHQERCHDGYMAGIMLWSNEVSPTTA